MLFLSALLLFVMTFLVNTVAELVRQRLREQVHGDLMSAAAATAAPISAATPLIWLTRRRARRSACC